MNKFLLSVALLAAIATTGAQNAAAQENSNQMSIRVAGYEVLLNGEEGPDHRHHHGHGRYRNNNYYGGRIGTLEIGFGGFRSTSGAYSICPANEAGFMDFDMARSIHLAVNLFTASTTLTRNNALGVTIGVGLAANNFRFDTLYQYARINNMIRPVAPERELKKAKLGTFAIRFPLAIEVNPTRDFFFSVGGYADLMVSSRLKWKKLYTLEELEDGVSTKGKLKNPYTNFVQAGLSARIGFRRVYAFANYSLVEMFRSGHGPRLNPYTFGLGFGF